MSVHRPGTRVEDLADERRARELLAGAGADIGPSGRLPLDLPCRAARVVPSGASERAALEEAAGDAGAALVRGRRAWVLAASARGLDETAARMAHAGDAPDLAGVLARTLGAYRRPPDPIRFADGETWDPAGPTRLMGILNVTPDSFSDGGRWLDPARAVDHGLRMADAGADIVDVGGESSRPGAAGVSTPEELRRVLPVIEGLRRRRPGLRLSIDTVKAGVARRAVEAGADMINDISGLRHDPEMGAAAAAARVPVVLMHLRGSPTTMQDDTAYDDLLTDVVDELAISCAKAVVAGVSDGKIIIDPGIGFGKSADGSEEILRHLATLRTLGRPVMVGASRKSFIGKRQGGTRPEERLEGSLAAAAAAIRGGALILRVHDVEATARLAVVTEAIEGGR